MPGGDFDLRYFVRKVKTLSLYRGLLRAARKTSPDAAVEIKRRFRLDVKDASAVPLLHREASEALRMLGGQKAQWPSETQDGDDDDVKGRVARGMPWNRK